MNTYKDIDAYVKSLPKEHAQKIKEMRALARKLIPKGEETIRYGMPTIQLNGKNFIHFAGMKGHVGFYPTPSGVKAYEEGLIKRGISYSKGCIRFPYEAPLPTALITKIIKFRLREEKGK
jgi:uncharacterized protein YdhG (YjbR/CyaY superfamily)